MLNLGSHHTEETLALKEIFMEEFIPALILTNSERIREGLSALLSAMPQIGVIGQLEHDGAALQLIPRQYRALVLLDASIPGNETWTALKQFKATNSQTRCLVLVGSTLQQRLARAAGADSVLLAGFSAGEFFTTIEKLLAQPD